MIPAKSFYIIRHGESEANAARITAGGQLDSPLNQTGIKQAETLARVIGHLESKPEVIYHSPMKRAFKTAEILNRTLGLEMIAAPDIRERDVGEWDGQPWDEIEPLMEDGHTPENGESDPAFLQRIQLTMTEILEKEDRLVMFVCHGGVFHALGTLYEYGMSRIQNCHLHYFLPYSTYEDFPWRAWHFDVAGDKLLKAPAQFCLSRALEKIAL